MGKAHLAAEEQRPGSPLRRAGPRTPSCVQGTATWGAGLVVLASPLHTTWGRTTHNGGCELMLTCRPAGGPSGPVWTLTWRPQTTTSRRQRHASVCPL